MVFLGEKQVKQLIERIYNLQPKKISADYVAGYKQALIDSATQIADKWEAEEIAFKTPNVSPYADDEPIALYPVEDDSIPLLELQTIAVDLIDIGIRLNLIDEAEMNEKISAVESLKKIR